MKTRSFDPNKLDVAAFAAAAGELDGEWPLATMDRIAELVPSEAVDGQAAPVGWHLAGEQRALRGGITETWLHLSADTVVAMQCQRCLQPVAVPVAVENSFRFVADEETAEAMDADAEEDILVLTRALDAHAPVEDEVLLALPVVALHDVCPEPLPLPPDDTDVVESPEDERPNPFAALQVLKRGTTN